MHTRDTEDCFSPRRPAAGPVEHEKFIHTQRAMSVCTRIRNLVASYILSRVIFPTTQWNRGINVVMYWWFPHDTRGRTTFAQFAISVFHFTQNRQRNRQSDLRRIQHPMVLLCGWGQVLKDKYSQVRHNQNRIYWLTVCGVSQTGVLCASIQQTGAYGWPLNICCASSAALIETESCVTSQPLRRNLNLTFCSRESFAQASHVGWVISFHYDILNYELLWDEYNNISFQYFARCRLIFH